MLTYLLEKFENIKKNRLLYCSQIENEKKGKEEKEEIKGKEVREITIYDFICKNTRKK
jgi:hypothetical protein